MEGDWTRPRSERKDPGQPPPVVEQPETPAGCIHTRAGREPAVLRSCTGPDPPLDEHNRTRRVTSGSGVHVGGFFSSEDVIGRLSWTAAIQAASLQLEDYRPEGVGGWGGGGGRRVLASPGFGLSLQLLRKVAALKMRPTAGCHLT